MSDLTCDCCGYCLVPVGERACSKACEEAITAGEQYELTVRLGEIVRESGVTADDCLAAYVPIDDATQTEGLQEVQVRVRMLLDRLAEALRRERR